VQHNLNGAFVVVKVVAEGFDLFDARPGGGGGLSVDAGQGASGARGVGREREV
jgi:hypothetical protein